MTKCINERMILFCRPTSISEAFFVTEFLGFSFSDENGRSPEKEEIFSTDEEVTSSF